MKKYYLFFILLPAVSLLSAQTVTDKLQNVFTAFEQDAQLKYAISSLYVLDSKTGKVIFEKNSRIGLAPASTQKIITDAAAFDLLGKDFRFKTEWSYDGNLTEDGVLKGNLIITGYGDPTLGSNRYVATDEKKLMNDWVRLLKQHHINRIEGGLLTDNSHWESQTIPDGWIWEDIGNYYGAGVSAINWRENQYDIILRSGLHLGDPVHVLRITPALPQISLINELSSGSKGSGDNAYIYLPPQAFTGYIRGSIPLGKDNYTISGAMPDPANEFIYLFENKLKKSGIPVEKPACQDTAAETVLTHRVNAIIPVRDTSLLLTNLFTHYSPALDSISYWFLRKSINLYGEALVKAIAFEKNGSGSTEAGIQIIKDHWRQTGIDKNELTIFDGSGLSPQNRITTHAQAEILKYARQQPWFSFYYNSFPEYNGIKMKSGTIKNVKGFCGYHTSKDGREYIFSFLVNNYHGNTASLIQKMYTVLNVLK